MASKPNKPERVKKTKSKSLFFLKALFAVSIVSAGLLVTYVIMIASRTDFFNLNNDSIQVNGENLGNAKDNSKVAAMEKTLNVDTIYENIYIEDVDVSRLTKEQAVRLLSGKFGNISDDAIIFEYNGEKYIKNFSDFDTKYDIEQAVAEAYDYARTGALSERSQKLTDIKKKPLKLKMDYLYDESKLSETVSEFALKFDILPKEPGFTRVDGEFVTSQGASGQVIDKEKLADDIRAVLESKKGGSVNIASDEVKPKYQASEFAKATSLLGSYTTYFAAGATNRNQNIITAASKINNCVVMPDEVFSTNKAFGDTTEENGYRMAGTYLGGKIVDGMGGGMCQVSTTLYMALLHAESEIVERANHSMKVGYADYGYDATLAGDYIDLKFKNSTNYPITIESVMTNNSVTVNIYGYETRNATRKLKFENALVSTMQPEVEKITNDPTLPLNKRAVDVEQKIGYKYQLYKFVYENDVLVEKVLVNTSTYRAVRGEVRIGTGPPEATPETAQPAPEPIVQSEPEVLDPAPPTEDDLIFMP